MSTLVVTPAIGSIEAYFAAVQKYPMLTLEEEQRYGRQVRDEGDQAAAAHLVTSHLRFVASTARKYKGYGLPEEDLVQEGNIGLMKAVKRFDPDQGIRLVSYAIHWIKAEIHEYVIKNFRLVKIATTKDQRKLFFNLRSMKDKLHAEACSNAKTLTPDEVKYIATQLNVKPDTVLEMEQRLGAHTFSLSPQDDSEDSTAITFDIEDETYEPTHVLENFQDDQLFDKIEEELELLDERDRDIINQRWLAPMIGETKVPLRVLADKHGISAERVRQLEERALAKVRKAIEHAKHDRSVVA